MTPVRREGTKVSSPEGGREAMRLAEHPLVRALEPVARTELVRRAIPRAAAADEVLWIAGAEPVGLVLVLGGEVRVVRSESGRQHVIHVERAGGTLGEVPLFSGGRYPATAIAAQPTRLAVIGPDALRAAVRLDPELAFTLLGRLAHRVRELIGRLDAMTQRSVPQRLAALVLARHEAAGGDAPFTLGAAQRDVAEELGTVREVLVRGLRELRERGLIESAGRGRFRVRDRRGLERLTRGEG